MTEGSGVDEQALFTTGGFREHQERRGGHEPVVNRHAGLVRDPKVSRYISRLRAAYDPSEADDPEQMPGTVWELSRVREAIRTCGTEVARKALDDGDYATLKHLMGDPQQEADVSGMDAIGRLRELVMGPAPVIVILGKMGTGKTDLALLLSQLWRRHLDDGAEPLVGTNIRTATCKTEWTTEDGERRDGWVASYGELEEWVQQDGEPTENAQRPKLFIGDEMSSGMKSTGKAGHLTRERMGPLVFKIRKYNGTLIVIGHDPSSIHPLLWRLGVILHKESKKTAVPANKIVSGEVRDRGEPITGIPPTDVGFETEEASSWSWRRFGDDDGDDYEPKQAARDMALYTTLRMKEEQGAANTEVAEFVPYSREWVRNRYDEFVEDGEHEEAVARVEEVIA